MAINDVSLTAGMRSNLLALQDTVNLLNRTQSRLSTGKKVNSAIDNPVSFFASQALTSRASVIDGLKDAMGQAVQTITAADKGIKAITSMIEQAKGIAQSALSAAEGATETEDMSAAHDVIYSSVTIDVDAMDSFSPSHIEFDVAWGDGNVVNIGAHTFTAVGAGPGEPGPNEFVTKAELLALIDAIDGYRVNDFGGDLVCFWTDQGNVVAGAVSGSAVSNLWIGQAGNLGDTIDIGGTTYMKGGVTNGFANAAALETILDAAGYIATASGESIDVSMVGTDVTVAEFNASEVASIAVDTAHADATVFTVGGQNFTASGATEATIATNLVADIEAAGIGNATYDAGAHTVTTALPSAELESLEVQYNTLLDQLTELAEDSGYKGKNLLSDDDLVVKFEGTTLTVEGFDASAAGLLITDATWTIGGSIDADVVLLDNALVTLRQESSKMSGNLSIITVRQEFSTNMINTLTEGADKLTLADTNEEGANMLMLQTRQSLSTTALSLSAQAAQSVLRLFQ